MKLWHKVSIACGLALSHWIEQQFPQLGVLGDFLAVAANLFWLFLG
jgi:hypothetical protein